jgi:hypothetical protein
VVARDRDHVAAEALEEGVRALVLVAPPAVGEVAARDHEPRLDLLDQALEGALDGRVLARAGVEIGDVEKP